MKLGRKAYILHGEKYKQLINKDLHQRKYLQKWFTIKGKTWKIKEKIAITQLFHENWINVEV